MTARTARKALRIALVVVGVIFVAGIYPLMQVWPSGWSWEPPQHEYEQMLLGVYATLGVFLLVAAKNPLEHRSLIGFTAWSSVVHGGIMGVQAVVDIDERGHLLGDVPALILVGIVLAVLLSRVRSAARESAGDAVRAAA